MSPLGSINPISAGGLGRVDAPRPPITAPTGPTQGPAGPGFSGVLDGLVGLVDAKQQAAASVTRQVLLGNTDHLHQSVIAMQEAGVAFSLMVEVRNKLVESYQELMRLQV